MIRNLLLRLLGCAAVVGLAALALPALSRPAAEEEKPLGKLPPDLQLISRDAVMVLSIRPADVVSSPLGRPLFKAKFMEKGLHFGSDISPVAASNIERITLVARRTENRPLAIVRTKKAYDAAALRKSLKTTRELKAHGKTFFAEANRYPEAVWFVDEKTFIVGQMRGLVPYIAAVGKPAKAHALAEELQATGKHTAVLAMLPSLMFRTSVAEDEARSERWKKEREKDRGRKEAIKDRGERPPPPKYLEVDEVKEDELKLKSMDESYDHVDRYGPVSAMFRPYVRANRFLVTADISDEIKLSARAEFGSESDAKDGQVAGRMALVMLRDAIPVMFASGRVIDIKEEPFAGTIKKMQAALREAEIKRDGKVLTASASGKLDTVALGKWVEDQAPAFKSAENLRQIADAWQAYERKNYNLPSQAICDKGGKPLLSWRVAILPFVGEEELYKQFKLDEPWDSTHNKKLLSKMPKLYAPTTGAAAEPDATYYQVFTGPDTLFPKPDAKARTWGPGFRDSPYSTFLVAEASKGVAWTKPEDMAVTAKSLPKLGGQFKGFFQVACVRGGTKRIKLSTEPALLRAYITPNGGERIPYEW